VIIIWNEIETYIESTHAKSSFSVQAKSAFGLENHCSISIIPLLRACGGVRVEG